MLLLAVPSTFVTVHAADPVNEELKALQGNWSLAAYEGDGVRRNRKVTAKEFGQEPAFCFLRIEGERLTLGKGEQRKEFVLRRGGKPKAFSFWLDPTADPKRFDLTFPGSAFFPGEQTLEGIYRLKDGRLEVCVNLAGTEGRPKDFTTPEYTWVRLLIYERVKEPPK
jgi:uncharacterized protein (TIGR03067 family)